MTTPGLFPGNINADVDSVPSLAAKELADDERQYLGVLHGRLREARGRYVQDARYYEGEQRVQDLGISIPPNLVNLRIPVGWGRVGVDALEERLHVDGFRFGDETDVDEDLAQILDANDFYDEHGFAHLDALIFGKAYAFTGPGDDPEIPLITCESPLNASAMWDPRTRKVTAALLDWSDTRVTSDTYGQRIVTLMLPARAGESRGRIVTMTQDAGKWDVQHRDDQALPYVTVARLANRQRSSNRDGLSEITREQRAIIDAATRTLLGAEVARELFAMPRRWAVGVAEDQFVKPDGTPVSKLRPP
jgi:hypothetical protein